MAALSMLSFNEYYMSHDRIGNFVMMRIDMFDFGSKATFRFNCSGMPIA
jgi:hypothetical protein